VCAVLLYGELSTWWEASEYSEFLTVPHPCRIVKNVALIRSGNPFTEIMEMSIEREMKFGESLTLGDFEAAIAAFGAVNTAHQILES
jgi:hypothetical protein